jgi:hypothetical protein
VIFEELQVPTGFHHRGISDNMSWQHRFVEDLFYYGGDMLLYCFSERGELKWSKVIQKSQFSQSNTLGLSYIPNMKGNQLDLFCYETAGKDNFYIFSLNTSDGSLSNKINLLPNDRYEFAKRYSAWLGDRTLLLFGITPTNTKKKKAATNGILIGEAQSSILSSGIVMHLGPPSPLESSEELVSSTSTPASFKGAICELISIVRYHPARTDSKYIGTVVPLLPR